MEDIYDSWIVKMPIAHRGLHGAGVPENSLLSFKKAIQNGYAIEIDVRPLASGEIIVFHDSSLERMIGKSGTIEKMTMDQIKGLKLKGTDEYIPTLREVLELVNGDVPILIEIKNEGKVGFEKAVWEELKTYDGEFAVQSFNPFSLGWFKKHAPHVFRGQLSSFFEDDNIKRYKKFILKRMWLNKVSKPDFICYNIENCPNIYVDKYRGKKPCLLWVVRSPADQCEFNGYCDNIIFEGFNPKQKNTCN